MAKPARRHFKFLIVGFIIGQFFGGNFAEFRIWYELLPLGWMMTADTVLTERPRIPETEVTSRRNSVLKGSYWLMMIALFTMATGIWVKTLLIPPEPEKSESIN
jgi:uncharacterized membrane protein